ncbi:alpha/beta-hydrolase family protein [Dermacoccaceae bacterium W4C1]
MAATGLLIAAVRKRAGAGWVRLRAGWRRLAGPPWKRSTWAALPAAVLIAGFPSFLPLPPMVFGAVVMLVLSPLSALARSVTRPFAAPPRPSLLATATASIAVTGGLMLWLTIAQNGLRVHGGLPPLGPVEVLTAATAATTVALLRRGLRSLWACRGRWWRPATAGALSLALISGTTTSAQAGAQDAASETNVLSSASTTGAARVFVPLSAGATPAERAARAVQDLRDAGGFDREHLVIVAPTGSGWVDPNLVSGLEDRFGAQVATLAVQYDDRPSWLAYLTARQQASESTLAVLRTVLRQVRALPADRRPQVHLAGESLGATAGQGALTQLTETERSQVCSALWVGTPGGRRTHLVTESMVANADDPVVHGSPAMLVSPAKAPTAPWLPMVSAAHVFADFTLSLAGPLGTGHRYGPDQVDGLAVCD